MFLVLTSYVQTFDKPVYYIMEFNDGVIHKWSRAVYDDYTGIVSKTTDEVNAKYGRADQEKILYDAICISYQETRDKRKAKMDSILTSISIETIPN